MYSLFAALFLAKRTPSFPTYVAKFVPSEYMGHLQLVDAKADLRAIGSSFVDMLDSHPQMPFAVWKGRTVILPGVTSDRIYWPSSIIDSQSIFASTSQDRQTNFFKVFVNSRVAVDNRRSVDIRGKIRAGKTNVTPKPVIHYRPLHPLESNEVTNELINNWSTTNRQQIWPKTHLSMVSVTSDVSVGSINYFPVVEGYEDVPYLHDSDQELAIIKFKFQYRLLTDCLTNPKDVKLRDIVWVPFATDSWMIVAGFLADKKGLFWLYKVSDASISPMPKGKSTTRSSMRKLKSPIATGA